MMKPSRLITDGSWSGAEAGRRVASAPASAVLETTPMAKRVG